MNTLCSLFKLFSLSYFVYLILSIGIIVGLVFLLKKFTGDIRKYISITFISLGVLFVFLDMLARMLHFKGEGIGDNLPLDTYHIFVYIIIVMFITKKESWTKFGYFVILPVTFLNLIFVPQFYTNVEPLSLGVFSFYMINVIVATYSILNLIWSDIYLYKKDILNSFLNFVMIIAGVHIFNVFMQFSSFGKYADYCGTIGENHDILSMSIASILPKGYSALIVTIPTLLYVLGVGFLMVIPFDSIRNAKDRQYQKEQIIALGNLKAQQNLNKKGKSQILVRSAEKAKPAVEKNVTQSTQNGGFVSVTKEVKVNKDKE